MSIAALNPQTSKIAQLQAELEGYRANMKTFVQKVEQEVSGLISGFQKQIYQLTRENSKLRKQLSRLRNNQSQSFLQNSNFSELSPIKSPRTPHEASTMLNTPYKFPQLNSMFETKYRFEEETSQLDDLSRSRFQIDKNRQKHKQQELLQSIESGKANLDLNTTRMFTILGKHKDVEEELQEDQEEIVTPVSKSVADPLNTSLSSLYDSLDTSFHAKKSRQKHQKKREKSAKARDAQLEIARQGQRIKKQQGLKNLLKTMRQNVEAPGSKATEIVKSSKLLSTGNISPTKKPKVMINPVPIDISKRSRKNDSINSSPSKSILKTSTILTKSIILGNNNSSVSFQ